ncbi:MAG: glycoside hydrolase family 88 protein [Clostridiales bacterium]|jgi:unsaturated chondroitin disaccharide hydrolase|nr:glycoside hydrolase family 88 protein [Clostridiales bacterium]
MINEITAAEANSALEAAVSQVRRNLSVFSDSYPNHSSVNNVYPPIPNTEWTNGFWPGMIWLAYERTGDDVFKEAGLRHVDSFHRRITNKIAVDTHDMGFLYTLACSAAYKLTGSERAREAAVLAADQLLSRFHEKGAFLQAWGALGAPGSYRYIIDCLMNVPLLYWASAQTGDAKYSDAADRHVATTLKYSVRPDGSTFHTVFMSPETGEMLRGETCQGYSDASSWARGQAWGILGTALAAKRGDKEAFAAFKRVTDYYMSRLPEDLVPYWDLIFTEGDEPRDSSSCSIAACGLMVMAGLAPEQESTRLISAARKMIKSLMDNYAVKDPAASNGLVLHATYSKKSPYNTCTPEGVDECCIWGDYFYMEALTRLVAGFENNKIWEAYWDND